MAWFNYGYTHAPLLAYRDYDGYRNRFGGQDSNIDLDDDDMSKLQEIAPDWTYEYRRPLRGEQEIERTRFGAERNWFEEDYYSNLEQEYDYGQFQWPDKYGWDQYA